MKRNSNSRSNTNYFYTTTTQINLNLKKKNLQEEQLETKIHPQQQLTDGSIKY